MKKISILISTLVAATLTSVSAYGQQLPAGNLVMQIDCTLADGVTFEEAVAYGRNQARDETQPNQVYYRQPIFVNPNFGENYDFRVALYYPNYATYVERTMATPSQAVQRAAENRSNVFTCNLDSQRISQVRPVNQENDGFPGDETLMTTRLCFLNEGSNVGDAFRFVQGVANNFSAAGENSLMQMYTRSLGPVPDGVSGGAVMVASVGETPESLAARLDKTREGLNPTNGLTSPMSCNYPALWRTMTVYRAAVNAQ